MAHMRRALGLGLPPTHLRSNGTDMTETFKEWLDRQRHTALESGVLARDVALDPDWPDSDDLDDLVRYLDWKGASEEAVARLRYVHVLYEVEAR